MKSKNPRFPRVDKIEVKPPNGPGTSARVLMALSNLANLSASSAALPSTSNLSEKVVVDIDGIR